MTALRKAVKTAARAAALIAAPLLLGALTGCAASSVFTPYPGQAQHYRAALNAGQPAAAATALSSKTASSDGLLYLLEKARLEQIDGQASASKASFDAAIARFDEQDNKALISASGYAAAGASLLTNDNARPYQGRLFERVFVHQYQALNYLAAGDSDGALVEVRRANAAQTTALAKKENSVDSAREGAQRKGFNASRYDNFFSPMDAAAGVVKTGFQNAATFYLSALIYEATGHTNDAYIDYRKALELAPSNTALQKDVVRTGLKAGMDDAKKLAAQIGNAQIGPKRGEGELVIYLEEGFVPMKQPLNVPIWTLSTSNNLSFPIYANNLAPSPLYLQVDGAALQAELLVDTRALAVRTLKDEVPAMLARAFLRLLTKQELQREARKADSTGLLGLATTIYGLVTDQADLRSWLTLPNSGQLLRLPLAAGSHTVSLPSLPALTVEVRNGRPTLLHLVVLPSKSYSQIYPL